MKHSSKKLDGKTKKCISWNIFIFHLEKLNKVNAK